MALEHKKRKDPKSGHARHEPVKTGAKGQVVVGRWHSLKDVGFPGHNARTSKARCCTDFHGAMHKRQRPGAARRTGFEPALLLRLPDNNVSLHVIYRELLYIDGVPRHVSALYDVTYWMHPSTAQ